MKTVKLVCSGAKTEKGDKRLKCLLYPIKNYIIISRYLKVKVRHKMLISQNKCSGTRKYTLIYQ